MKRATAAFAAASGLAAAVLSFSDAALAADAITGAVQKAETNWTAITMFLLFVAGTLGITYWAASKTKSAKDFYAAGGGITGFQNGLAIAGDYMSAASFLGISALVYTSGFDGLIYSIFPLLSFWTITSSMLSVILRKRNSIWYKASSARWRSR